MRTHKSIIALALLSCNVLIWFREGLPIGFSDGGLQTMFYQPGYLFHDSLRAWSDNELGGVPTYSNISLAPLYLLALILRKLGLGLTATQAIIFYLIEFVGMATCRRWLLELFREQKFAEIISFTGAIFYAFNLMTALTFWFWDKLNITTIAAVPFLLMAIEFVFRRSKLLGCFFMSLAMFVGSSLFLNGITLVPVVILCMVYSLARLIQLSHSIQDIASNGSKLVISLLLASCVNAWVILPFVGTANTYYSNSNFQTNVVGALQNATAWSTWSGLLRFLPFGDAPLGAWLYKMPGWRSVYTSTVFEIIGYTILLIIAIGIFGQKSKDRRLLLASIFVCGLLIQAGAKGPFGQIVRYVVFSIPFGHVLRTPWRSVAPLTIVGSSALFGLGMASFFAWLKRKSAKCLIWVFSLSLLFACGVYVFPMWSGKIIGSPIRQRGGTISAYVSIPTAYKDVANYLSQQSGWFRILGLPLSPTSYLTTNWPSGYDGSDQRWLIFHHPMISFTSSGAFPAVVPLGKFISNSFSVNFDQLIFTAEQLSCRFIVVDGYMITKTGAYYNQSLHSSSYFNNGLKEAGLQPVLTAGKLTVYKLPLRRVVPISYAVSLKTMQRFEYGSHITSTNYQISIPRARGKKLLVVGQNFNPGWIAFVRGTVNGKVVTFATSHLEVNGFANGWIVNFPRNTVGITANLVYAPQKYNSDGFGFSILGLTILAIAATRSKLSRKLHFR